MQRMVSKVSIVEYFALSYAKPISSRSPETVQCDRCKKFFHMGCVQPPLLAKPSRGYGWTCAPCSQKHEEEVDSHDVRHVTPVIIKPKSNAPAPRGRGSPRKAPSLREKTV